MFWLLLLLLSSSEAVMMERGAVQLKLGVELTNQIVLAPGSVFYVLTGEGILPYETIELRASYLSIPPAKFTFEILPFIPARNMSSRRLLREKEEEEEWLQRSKRRWQRRKRIRRRGLDTEIVSVMTGKTGFLLDGTKLPALIKLSVMPTGVTAHGKETKVQVKFNLIAERKVLDNLLPYSAWKMILWGAGCFLLAAFCFVRLLFKALHAGDGLSTPNNGNKTL